MTFFRSFTVFYAIFPIFLVHKNLQHNINYKTETKSLLELVQPFLSSVFRYDQRFILFIQISKYTYTSNIFKHYLNTNYTHTNGAFKFYLLIISMQIATRKQCSDYFERVACLHTLRRYFLVHSKGVEESSLIHQLLNYSSRFCKNANYGEIQGY